MQPDATRKSRFRAATARECHLALRATKSNEDARSSGAGALARGPAPSPVHRPQAGRACAYSTERLPGILHNLQPNSHRRLATLASAGEHHQPSRTIQEKEYEANSIWSFVFNKSESGKPISNRGGSPGVSWVGATERNVMQHEIVKWLVVAGAVGLSLRWRQPRTSSSGLQHNCACCVAFPKPPC